MADSVTCNWYEKKVYGQILKINSINPYFLRKIPHQNQDEYQKRYDGLVQRYDTTKARYDEVVAAISAKEAQSERLADFIKVLKAQDGNISEFDGSLWGSMVEFVMVGRDKEITVTFRDGSEIKA